MAERYDVVVAGGRNPPSRHPRRRQVDADIRPKHRRQTLPRRSAATPTTAAMWSRRPGDRARRGRLPPLRHSRQSVVAQQDLGTAVTTDGHFSPQQQKLPWKVRDAGGHRSSHPLAGAATIFAVPTVAPLLRRRSGRRQLCAYPRSSKGLFTPRTFGVDITMKQQFMSAAAIVAITAGLSLAGLGAAASVQAQPGSFQNDPWCGYWNPYCYGHGGNGGGNGGGHGGNGGGNGGGH